MEVKAVIFLCFVAAVGGYVLYPIIQRYRENKGKAKWRKM